MVNDKVPHKCWLEKLNKEAGFQGWAVSSNGLGTSPSQEMCKRRWTQPVWMESRASCISSYTPRCTLTLKAPRSQALKRLILFWFIGCFPHLFGLWNPLFPSTHPLMSARKWNSV